MHPEAKHGRYRDRIKAIDEVAAGSGQEAALIQHLEAPLDLKMEDIQAHVAEVRMRPESLGITLYDLPPYSPNLNPIERVGRVMNEQDRKNVYFKFIQAIRGFFQDTWKRPASSLIDKSNDTFQTIESSRTSTSTEL